MLRSAILRNSSSVRSRYWLLRAEPRSGAVDLQHEAGFDDRPVFGLHHLGQRLHVGVLGRVMQVDDEAGQDAGRGRGHEHVRRLRFRRRRLEVRDVAVERAAILVAQRSDAAGKRRRRRNCRAAGEIRMRQQVAADHDVAAFLGGARIGLDALDAVTNVGGVGRLAHLAVADHVDAGRDLLRHHLVHRLGGRGLERRGIDRLALLAAENEVDQRLAAGAGCRCAW